MKYLSYILIALIAGVLFYIGFFNAKSPPENLKAEQPTGAAQRQWETKIDDQPPVTIKVTPLEFGKNAAVWKFDIAFDAHSESLDNDMMKTALIADDKGNLYPPTAWEGPGPGGHHREGVLIFNPITPAPKYIELKIKNVGGVVERSFTWSLE